MAEITDTHKNELGAAIQSGDEALAEALARRILDSGMDPLAIVQEILIPNLTTVGERFQNFEIYLPELMMAGNAAERITALVEAATLKAGKTTASLGTVVLGQVEGDMHDIGRNIVGTLMSSHGFKVIDLGRDVRASAFLEAAQKEQADIIALSALMTTTLPAQRRTIRLFEEIGNRGDYRIIVGGGAVNQAWADEIGADGYSPDAAGAVALCKSLLA